MDWNSCKDAFHQDGSLRDIYIPDVDLEVWEEFVSFIKTAGFELKYFRDEKEATLPLLAADILSDRTCLHNLRIDLGGVDIACHFFTSDEIELDIDPRQVTSQAALDSVLSFLSAVGTRLSRDVILTEENSPGCIWFRYSAKDGQLCYLNLENIRS